MQTGALVELARAAPDAAATLFSALVRDAPTPCPRTHDHVVLRLALHGLAAGAAKSGHDLLLATLLDRPDGAAFLPTLAPLVGLPALDPDPFWD